MRGHDEDADARLPGLDGLYADREPPPGLEDRMVEGLRKHGLVGTQRAWNPPGAMWHAAAALVVFAAGVWVGTTRRVATTPEQPLAAAAEGGPRYMLLLWEDERFDPPEDPGAVAAAYRAWAGALAERGVPVTGDELGVERALLGPSTVRPSDGATIGGYFTLGAASLEEARRLVEGHPHLVNGGAIEIAPIVER